MLEYQRVVLKITNQIPPKPKLNKDVVLKFKEGNRDKFIALLKEALKQRAWLVI
jgi:hypothetical protein